MTNKLFKFYFKESLVLWYIIWLLNELLRKDYYKRSGFGFKSSDFYLFYYKNSILFFLNRFIDIYFFYA